MKITSTLAYVACILQFGAAQCWEQQFNDANFVFNDVEFVDEKFGIAVGNAGLIMRTTDGGKNWIKSPGGSTSTDWSDVFILESDPSKIWIAGQGFNQNFARSIDGGLTWNISTKENKSIFHKIYFFNQNEGFAFTSKSGIYRMIITSDAGSTFSEVSGFPTINTPIKGLHVFPNKDMMVAGDDGFLKHYEASINKWKDIYFFGEYDKMDWQDVLFLDDLRGAIIGKHDTMLITTNGGVTWDRIHKIENQGASFLNDLEPFGDDRILITGSGAYVFIFDFTNDSLEFEKVDWGCNLGAASFPSTDHGWIVGKTGCLYHYIHQFTAEAWANDASVCWGDSLFLNASGGKQYQWTGPSGFSSYNQNPVISYMSASREGTYNVRISNDTCSTTRKVQVTVLDNPYFWIDAGKLNCKGTGAKLAARSNAELVQFEWTGPQGLMGNDSSVVVLVPGSYSVMVTDVHGCTSQKTVQVLPPANLPSLQVLTPDGNQLKCQGSALSLQAFSNAGNATFNWTGPQGFSATGSSNISVSIPGTYSVTVTDVNGCTRDTSLEIGPPPPLPEILILSPKGTTLACKEALPLQVGSNPPGAEFTWSGPQNFQDTASMIMVNLPGAYSVTITDSHGCTRDTSIWVQPPPDIPSTRIHTPDGTVLTCLQKTLALLGGSDTTNVTYEWLRDGMPYSGSKDTLASQPGMYKLTVRSLGSDCSSDSTITISESKAAPTIQWLTLQDSITCTKKTAELSVSSNGTSFSWQGPGVTGVTGPQLNPDRPGTYILTVTGSNGCSVTTSAQVKIDTMAPIILGTSIVWSDCEQDLHTLEAEGLPLHAMFQWYDTNGTLLGNSPGITVQGPGTYTVQLTTENGCTAVASQFVQPALGFDPPTIITPNGDGRNDKLQFAYCGMASAPSLLPSSIAGARSCIGPAITGMIGLRAMVSICRRASTTISWNIKANDRNIR